jgi:hypothetical protein
MIVRINDNMQFENVVDKVKNQIDYIFFENSVFYTV